MSKNLTRKGLAFGALVALGSTLIAGAPAHAAGAITLQPNTGTAWNTLTNSAFSVSPVVTGIASDEYKYLNYKVANASEVVVIADMQQGNTDDGETLKVYGATTDARTSIVTTNVVGTNVADAGLDTITVTLASPAASSFKVGDVIVIDTATAAADNTVTVVAAANWDADDEAKLVGSTIVYYNASALAADLASTDEAGTAKISTADATARTSNSSFTVQPDARNNNNANAIGGVNELVLDLFDNTVAANFTVQAWIDGNQNNTIDTGETVSDVVTVGFKTVSTLSASASLSGTHIGSESLTASVTFTGDINYQQIAAGQVTATLDSSVAANDVAAQNVVWSTTAGAFTSVFDLSGANEDPIIAGETFSVAIKVDDANDGNVNDTKVTATATAASALTTPTLVSNVVASATALDANNAVIDADADALAVFGAAGAGTGKFKVDGIAATAGEVEFFVGTDAATPAAQASQAIRVSVNSSGISLADAVLVNAKKLVSGTVTSFDLTTGSDGKAKFTVTPAAADNGDTITVDATVGGVSFAQLVITLSEGSYSVTPVIQGARSIKALGTVAIDYQVADEFGAAPKDGTHQVTVTPLSSERTTAPTFTQSYAVVAGKATASIVDNGAGVGKFTVNAKLALNSNNANSVGTDATTVVHVVADNTPATITLKDLTYGTGQKDVTADVDNTAKLVLAGKTFANYDSRNAVPTTAAPKVVDTNKVVVGGTVKTSGAVAVPGTPVTIAAAGFLFFDGTRYGADTITVYTGADGTFSVNVWSNVGGVQSIKITAGAATAAQALTYAAGTTTAATHSVVTSSSYVVPGRTLDVTVNVKDKFGNATQGVAVTLRSTGAGYLQASTGTTDASGNVYVKLISGVNDYGTATIIATVTIAGVATDKSATVNVGTSTAVVAASGSTAKFYVSATAAAGKTVVVKVAGKFVKSFVGTAVKKVVALAASAGSKAVTVFVGGKLALTKTVTVK